MRGKPNFAICFTLHKSNAADATLGTAPRGWSGAEPSGGYARTAGSPDGNDQQGPL